MHATLRPYVAAGVALAVAFAIALTPIAATPPDVRVANPAAQLTASPFDAYEMLLDNSRANISGLISLALAPPPALPFSISDLISQALEVETNVDAFRELLSGLSGQVDSLNQLNRLFLQAASSELQAGNFEDALDILLYAALFNGSGVLAFALYPAALLGLDVEELTPEIAGATFNALVAPGFSGVAVTGQIAQDVLDAVKSGEYQQIAGDLIAAPVLLADGVLNGAVLQTSVFGPVAIPGILTDTTLLDSEGPGPISLGIQLVQFVRGLVTPPASDVSTVKRPEPERVSTSNLYLDLNAKGDDAVPSTDAHVKDEGLVPDEDKVTNADTGGPSSTKKSERLRLPGVASRDSQTVWAPRVLKILGEGVRDGIQDLHGGIRDEMKPFTGRGNYVDRAEKRTDDTTEIS